MHVQVAQPQHTSFDVRTFGRYLETILKQRAALLPRVGGNFAVHVPGVATWIVVTQGPRPSVSTKPSDEPLAFAMMCPADVLESLFGGGDADLEAEMATGRVELAGDPTVLVRFLELNAGQSMLALRSDKSDKPVAARRPTTSSRGMR